MAEIDNNLEGNDAASVIAGFRVADILRKMGDRTAREYAENSGEPLDAVRKLPVKTITEEWNFLKKKGVIPRGLLMREFRVGWRDSAVNIIHGKPSGYNQGCRCKLCKLAIAEYQRNY